MEVIVPVVGFLMLVFALNGMRLVFEVEGLREKARKLSKELRGIAMDQPKLASGEYSAMAYIDSAKRIEKEFGIQPTGPFQREEDD